MAVTMALPRNVQARATALAWSEAQGAETPDWKGTVFARAAWYTAGQELIRAMEALRADVEFQLGPEGGQLLEGEG